MKITDALLGEHGALYAIFDHVRETALAAGAGLDELHRAAALLESVLASHARIEEDMLFPALERHLGGDGPLAVMRHEHRLIEDRLQAARDGTDPAAVRNALTALLDLTRSHFRKEEQVLFAMAQRYLDAGSLDALGDDWSARRGVALGGGGCPGMG